MTGVDLSNQLRKNLTVHRAYERRIWRPLWYYILDVCAVNSYLIWQGDTKDQGKRGQRRFRKPLIEALLNILYPESRPMPPPMPLSVQTHRWDCFEKRGYCLWCKKYAEE
jgi:hypothetical protein